MRACTAVMLLGLLVVTGCGGDDPGSDERAVLKLMEEARAALLKGDSRACDQLTPHARKRTLGFQVNYLEEGTRVPSSDPRAPQTCEAILRAEFRDEHRPNATQSWTPDLRQAKFRVVELTDTNARVLLRIEKPHGPELNFRLRKTSAGWRIDDSNAVPSAYWPTDRQWVVPGKRFARIPLHRRRVDRDRRASHRGLKHSRSG